jgi:hypothetical protein
MSIGKNNGSLPPDIGDDEKYQKITLYYDHETGSCFVTADHELSNSDIYDILASGIESIDRETEKSDSKEYIN